MSASPFPESRRKNSAILKVTWELSVDTPVFDIAYVKFHDQACLFFL